MSDHWEFYPCQMGDDRAFIFYDHGIKDILDSLEYSHALRIRVLFDDPTDAGMPTNTEFPRLSRLEDILTAHVEQAQGIYVGRVTVAGARYFHCFISTTDAAAGQLVQAIGNEGGYELELVLAPDPEKKTYWDDLFPTPSDWRVIQDMKVLDVLKERGDDPSIPRRVDHWLYFPSAQQQDLAAQWAVENGFSIQDISDPAEDSAEYELQIFHVTHPRLEEITSATALLQEKAEELGGSYDGWETQVETPGPDPQ